MQSRFKHLKISTAVTGLIVCATTETGLAKDSQANKPVVEEIIVTAQKRGDQLLQDVPVSISVISGVELDNASYEGANDAIAEVAGVSIYDTQQGGGSKISIRGVTSNASIFSGSGTVAYYLDNIPFGFVKTPLTPDANAYDLDQVEVVRGPQGTLYGASALGGVVLVRTKNANVDEFEAKVRTSFSNSEDGDINYSGDLAVNLPIIPGKLAVRGVIGYQDNDGWIDSAVNDNVNDSEIQTYRIKVGAQPRDDLRIDFLSWFSRNERGGPDSSLEDRTNPVTFDEEKIVTDYDAYGLNIEYDFGNMVLTSSTSYIDYSNEGDLQLVVANSDPGSALVTILDNEVLAQEIRLYSTNDGPWNWSIGGFYRDAEDFRVSDLPVFFPNAPSVREINESKSYAIFGEVTGRFFDDQLEVTAGLRYFEDDVDYAEFSRLGQVPIPAADLIRSGNSFDVVTPRVSLTWFLNDDTTLYASYSQGFRSGFEQGGDIRINSTGSPEFESVEEDLLTNYEIGVKGFAVDEQLRYDLALYYIDWEDTQQQLFAQVPLGNGTTVSVTTPINGEDASGFGFDASLNFDLTDRLIVGASYSWNDLTFDAKVITAADVEIYDDGDRLPESPEKTASLNASYKFPVGSDGWDIRLYGSANYTSALESRSASSGALFEGDSIFTAKIGLELSSSQDWSAVLFVDNLTDEDGVVRPVSSSRPWLTPRLRPRTVGVRFNKHF